MNFYVNFFKDIQQKAARIERLRLLSDETILTNSYPRKPQPKVAEAAAEE